MSPSLSFILSSIALTGGAGSSAEGMNLKSVQVLCEAAKQHDLSLFFVSLERIERKKKLAIELVRWTQLTSPEGKKQRAIQGQADYGGQKLLFCSTIMSSQTISNGLNAGTYVYWMKIPRYAEIDFPTLNIQKCESESDIAGWEYYRVKCGSVTYRLNLDRGRSVIELIDPDDRPMGTMRVVLPGKTDLKEVEFIRSCFIQFWGSYAAAYTPELAALGS